MIFLFGSTGYIGKEFARTMNLHNIEFYTCPSAKISTYDSLEKMYEDLNYPVIDAVINAAGYTGKPNVDACELPENKEDTIHGNLLWPQILTDFCMLNDIPLGHVSSGCIYTGKREDDTPFTEEDEPNFTFKQGNCSFYSGTKALAEKIVSKYDKSWIWRLRIPFEEFDNPRNYLSKVINYQKLLNAENSMSNKTDFVLGCLHSITNKIPYGTYNITNPGYVTTKQVTEMIQKTIVKDKKFEFFESEESFYSQAAPTPRSNCVMSSDKILSTGFKMMDVEESIYYCLNNWQ